MAEMNITRIPNLSINTADGSAASQPSLSVGTAGTTIYGIVSLRTAHDFASISASSFIEQSFVLPGASGAAASVIVHPEDSTYSGTYRAIVFEGRASGTTGTVTVKASNLSTAAIDMASQQFRVTAINFA
jgi:hypothetical protein